MSENDKSENDKSEEPGYQDQKQPSLFQAIKYHKLSLQNRKCKVVKREMFTKMKHEKSKVIFLFHFLLI